MNELSRERLRGPPRGAQAGHRRDPRGAPRKPDDGVRMRGPNATPPSARNARREGSRAAPRVASRVPHGDPAVGSKKPLVALAG
eukprot:7980319-Pyramimonas_sp.AAC.1